MKLQEACEPSGVSHRTGTAAQALLAAGARIPGMALRSHHPPSHCLPPGQPREAGEPSGRECGLQSPAAWFPVPAPRLPGCAILVNYQLSVSSSEKSGTE